MVEVNGNKKGIFLSLTVLIVLAFIVSATWAEGPKTANKPLDSGPIINLANPKAEFKVDLWTDREDATYKIGDKVTFFFKTNKDCRVTLLNLGTDGQVQILFPNEYDKNNLVTAGTIYRIPPKEAKFVFKAKAPAGEDTVKVIATLDKVDLIKDEDIIPVKGFIKGFKGVNKNVKTLTIELEETLKPVNPPKWAEAQKVVSIVP